MLKLRCHIRNPTPLSDAHLLEEHSYQVSPQSNLKQRSLKRFCRQKDNDDLQNCIMSIIFIVS